MLDSVAVILGPVIAMVIGHVFAASLSNEAELGRRPTRGELLRTVGRESWFLLVAAPQIILLLVLSLVGLSMSDTIQVLIWAGALSLGFWGGLAAQQAGLGGRGGTHLTTGPSRRSSKLAVDQRVSGRHRRPAEYGGWDSNPHVPKDNAF